MLHLGGVLDGTGLDIKNWMPDNPSWIPTNMLPTMLQLMVACTSCAQSLPLDLQDEPVNVLGGSASKVTVFVFVRTDCPISNRYAPEIQRLYAKFESLGVSFWLVDPNPDDSAAVIRKYLAEYNYVIHALRDPQHTLVNLAKVRVTPEAAVFGPASRLLYHGRIDDRYIYFGKARPAARSRDLETAIEVVLAGRVPSAAGGPAIGCYIQ
jgi:hypothetical protein